MNTKRGWEWDEEEPVASFHSKPPSLCTRRQFGVTYGQMAFRYVIYGFKQNAAFLCKNSFSRKKKLYIDYINSIANSLGVA